MNLEVEQYNNSLQKQRLRCSKTEAEFILNLENLEIGHFMGSLGKPRIARKVSIIFIKVVEKSRKQII